MAKIIIAGGRDFNNYDMLHGIMDEIIKTKQLENVEIVSGRAEGADILGEWYASTKSYPVKKFPADWKTYGKAAGPIRNKQMAEYADALVAFWDGKSRGTNNMIDTMKSLNKPTTIIFYSTTLPKPK